MSTTTCILVTDGARGRFFTRMGDRPGSTRLLEHSALVNPEHNVPGHELYSDPRSDAQGRVAGRSYTLDDGREAHREETDKHFVGLLYQEAERLAQELGLRYFTLVAEPRMLGRLRKAFEPLERRGAVAEIPHDLAGRTPAEIAEYLDHHPAQ